jgi:hypothetical protein
MTRTLTPESFINRLERVGSGKRVIKEELEDLAEYEGEVKQWANELECKMADFAANVQMLTDPETPRGERADLRAQMIADAEAVTVALQAISQWCY